MGNPKTFRHPPLMGVSQYTTSFSDQLQEISGIFPFARIPICSRITCKEIGFPFWCFGAFECSKLSHLTRNVPIFNHSAWFFCEHSHLLANNLQWILGPDSHLLEFPFARERTVVCHIWSNGKNKTQTFCAGHKKTPEINELESVKKSLKIWTHNFEKQKS